MSNVGSIKKASEIIKIEKKEAGNTRYLKKKQLLYPISVYEEAKRRHSEISEILNELEKSLDKAPPGKIHVVKSTKRTQFYLRSDSSDKSGRYISKSDETTIKTYLQKSYDEKVSKLLNAELINLEKNLKKSNGIISKIRNLYSKNPEEVKKYITPIDISDEDYVKEWLNIPYIGKEINENLPFYETNKKERVRSKSELYGA